jgi:hypothetical protein
VEAPTPPKTSPVLGFLEAFMDTMQSKPVAMPGNVSLFSEPERVLLRNMLQGGMRLHPLD